MLCVERKINWNVWMTQLLVNHLNVEKKHLSQDLALCLKMFKIAQIG